MSILPFAHAALTSKGWYALKYPPKYYSMAKLPAGSRIQTSIANYDAKFGPGGAMQIELLRRPIPEMFLPPKSIAK